MKTRTIEETIQRLLQEKMAITVPSATTDLVDAGQLDSLMLAELLSHVEAELTVRVPIAELDLDQIRSVAGLARVVKEELCRSGGVK